MSTLKQISGKISDTESKVIRVDGATEGLNTINHVEHSIHEGNHYYMEGYTTLNDGDTLYVKLVTPDTTEWAHMSWDIISTGELTTEFYEGASGGMTGGTSVTPLNSDRNSSNTSNMTITKGVTAPTSTGTTISQKKFGTSGGGGFFGGSGSGGSDNRNAEIILKQNTTYCRKFLSGSDSNIVSFRAVWGEHINKN